MGNLVRKPLEMLVNTVDSDVIAANAAGTGVIIKNRGEVLSARQSWEGLAGDVAKQTTVAGVASIQLVNIKAACGTAPIYGSISLKKRVKLTGQVGMSQNIQVIPKSYDGVINALSGSCSGGYIPAADNTSLATQIVAHARAEKYPFFYIGKAKVLDVTDKTAPSELDVTVDGTLTAVDNATLAGMVGEINAIASGKVYAWSVDGTGNAATLYIVPVGNYDITTGGHNGNIADSTTYTDVISVTSYDPKYTVDAEIREIDGTIIYRKAGTYPYLSTEDMYRIFPIHSYDEGSMPMLPIQGVSYSKYQFNVLHDAYALEGANHKDQYYERMDIYVAHSGTNIATFDAALKAGGFLVNGVAADPTYDTADFTITGDATADGQFYVSVDGQDWSIDIADTTTAANIAAAIAAAINPTSGITCTADGADVTIVKAAGITTCTVTDDVAGSAAGAVTLS